MRIELAGTGKRFNREWIFRKADLQFEAGKAYAITGPNGSGKSTLLQTIGGMLQPSAGSVTFYKNGQPIASEDAYRHITLCAPYLDVIEEMSLTEFLHFHYRFKSPLGAMNPAEVIQTVGLERAAGKQIRYFSSGMKQRVRLAQAILSNTSVVLLDEPCSNLDATGIELYHSLIERFCTGRLVIVSSNDEVEYRFCTERIRISDYK